MKKNLLKTFMDLTKNRHPEALKGRQKSMKFRIRIFQHNSFLPLTFLLVFSLLQNCSELSFRSDPLSMTLVKYENRSSNKYMFLAHEGDDCHLLRHKRIHNFFFFFPLNSFSKEELQEISQQKMIRYKNIMRLGDFAWTFFLLPATVLTYSIEVETCNTGMVAVTRKDPLYLESLKNNKGNSSKEESVAVLDKDTPNKKAKSRIQEKSINPNPNSDTTSSGDKESLDARSTKEESEQNNYSDTTNKKQNRESEDSRSAYSNNYKKENRSIDDSRNTNDSVIDNRNAKDFRDSKDSRESKESRYSKEDRDNKSNSYTNDSRNAKENLNTEEASNQKPEVKKKKKKKGIISNSMPTEVDPNLPPEDVWNSAVVADETTIDLPEIKEDFNPEVYKLDGTLPIIWNYKNSITNRINENVKPFSILFGKNETDLTEDEEKKLDAFASEYLESYGTSKILLIGHSEWAKGKGVKLTLSQYRAESVRNYLIEKKVPTENILLTFSGGLWGETNEKKMGKEFSRRVDIVFLY
ncbi:MAG TPA: OmpA family protein [Leptospiraceae bacterium]|nr:OmpA family protein [Leptospiraceae bacterium]HRG76885.1 OmpA family protein [Leptospiraceae bacterium]